MYYTRIRERTRYGGWDDNYTPVKDLAAEVSNARRKVRRARKARRTIGTGFLGGVGLVLGQFPFSLLDSTPLTVSTAILGGVSTLVFGWIWVGDMLLGDVLPDVDAAHTELDRVSNLYTKELLGGGGDDVG